MPYPFNSADPQRVAPALGRLVARGLLARGEALSALADAAREGSVAPAGLHARLAGALDDAARAHGLARVGAAKLVRWAARAGIARQEPRWALLNAARAADPDGLLTPAERGAVVAGEEAWSLCRPAGRRIA